MQNRVESQGGAWSNQPSPAAGQQPGGLGPGGSWESVCALASIGAPRSGPRSKHQLGLLLLIVRSIGPWAGCSASYTRSSSLAISEFTLNSQRNRGCLSKV